MPLKGSHSGTAMHTFSVSRKRPKPYKARSLRFEQGVIKAEVERLRSLGYEAQANELARSLTG